MPEYIVKEALRHDGERYKPGDPVEMPAAKAKPLLAAGTIEAPRKGAKPGEKDAA